MKNIIIPFVMIVLLSCFKDDNPDIPDFCQELGYIENPVLFENGFFVEGILNDQIWRADNGYLVVNYDTLIRDAISFYIYENNSCNLRKLFLRNYSVSEVNKYDFDLTKKNDNPPFCASYNYGQADELVVTQAYDSLVVSPNFENYIIFDFVSPDTSIIEGRFQFHLTKSHCHYFSDGSLRYCAEPDYWGSEPKDLIFTDGKFRLKRNE